MSIEGVRADTLLMLFFIVHSSNLSLSGGVGDDTFGGCYSSGTPSRTQSSWMGVAVLHVPLHVPDEPVPVPSHHQFTHPTNSLSCCVVFDTTLGSVIDEFFGCLSEIYLEAWRGQKMGL